MASIISTVDSSHEDLIHDAALDYYGLKLATCSSDRSVKIFDAAKQSLIEDLRRHEGPVWQVAWSHPMFGNYLASCSYDKKVIIWKETPNNKFNNNTNWSAFYEYCGHESSVNTVAWAPSEYGLIFACGSSDGSISIVSLNGDGNWQARKIDNAHPTGCTSVSWAPAFPQDDSQVSNGLSMKRIASGGCDNVVKIWREEQNGQWVLDQTLTGHNEWVRDVAWSPNIIHSKTNIASCSQGGKVIIWSSDLNDSSNNALSIWKSTVLNEFNSVAWHVSWSLSTNMLAVSTGDNKTTIWKEDHYGKYICINDEKLGL